MRALGRQRRVGRVAGPRSPVRRSSSGSSPRCTCQLRRTLLRLVAAHEPGSGAARHGGVGGRLALFYAFFVLWLLHAIAYFRVRSVWALLLAGAICGWAIEAARSRSCTPRCRSRGCGPRPPGTCSSTSSSAGGGSPGVEAQSFAVVAVVFALLGVVWSLWATWSLAPGRVREPRRPQSPAASGRLRLRGAPEWAAIVGVHAPRSRRTGGIHAVAPIDDRFRRRRGADHRAALPGIRGGLLRARRRRVPLPRPTGRTRRGRSVLGGAAGGARRATSPNEAEGGRGGALPGVAPLRIGLHVQFSLVVCSINLVAVGLFVHAGHPDRRARILACQNTDSEGTNRPFMCPS